VVMLDLVCLRCAFRGRYLLIEAEHGISGRAMLNHVTLLLDGPRQQWSEPSAEAAGAARPRTRHYSGRGNSGAPQLGSPSSGWWWVHPRR
jgi:hypothetical protein